MSDTIEEIRHGYISALASNILLLLEAISKNNATEASTLCDDATSKLDEVQLHITKLYKDCTSSATQLWLM